MQQARMTKLYATPKSGSTVSEMLLTHCVLKASVQISNIVALHVELITAKILLQPLSDLTLERVRASRLENQWNMATRSMVVCA